MGNQESNVKASNIELTSGADNIFNTNYLEIPFKERFDSDLFKNSKNYVEKKIKLPESELMTDIITDIMSYTSADTKEEVWSEILIPLFKGSEETKNFFQQILLQNSEFLKDRAKSGFEFEDERRERERQKNEQKRGTVIRIHAFVDNENQNNEETDTNNDEILSKIPVFNENFKIIPIKGNNSIANNYMSKNFGNSVEDLADLVAIGFGLGELAPIIIALKRSLLFLFDNNNDDSYQINTTSILNVGSIIKNINLMNSCFIPTIDGVISSIPLRIRNRKNYDTGFFTTSGNAIYITDTASSITKISLERSMLPDSYRYSSISIPTHAESIACSNGYLLIIQDNGKMFVKKYDEDKLEEVCTKYAEVGIKSPIVSDGVFIYSIRKNLINIFLINQGNLIFVREVKIKIKDYGKNSVIYYTNGISLSTLTYINEKSGRWIYSSRHYSLIDGHCIGSVIVKLQYPIVGLQYDSTNNCIWGVSRVVNHINLVKYPMDSAKPPWLTGLNPDAMVSIYFLIEKSQLIQTVHDVSIYIHIFLCYMSAYLSGSKFAACLNNPLYSIDFARFFGPTTPEFINIVVDTIEFVMESIKKGVKVKKWDEKVLLNTLTMLLRILDYNLSNFETRITEDCVIDLEDTERYLKILYELYTTVDFENIKSSISFTVIHNLEILIKVNKNLGCELFEKIYNQSSTITKPWITNSVIELDSFVYCINSRTIRPIFAPILKSLVNKGDVLQIQKEFLECYMSAIIYEMRNLLEKHSSEFPPEKMQIYNSFQTFSALMVENAMNSYRLPEQSYEFITIFSKWMMLIKTFTKFSRTSAMMVSLIQPLFNIAINKIKELPYSAKNANHFNKTWGVFLEIYTLFADFIQSLTQGGNELHEATKYAWLVTAAEKSNLTADLINIITTYCFDKDNSEIAKCLAFPNNEQITRLFLDIINKKEKEDVKMLMDYLYNKVNNPFNKRLTNQERHMERITLLVFIKHLNLSNTISDIINELHNNKTPTKCKKLKKIMNVIYAIRRIFKASKQTTQMRLEEAENNMVPYIPKNIVENYPLFLENYLKKCIYLIMISLENDDKDFETENDFTQTCNDIKSFLSNKMSLNDFFDVMKAANIAKACISTGICLINDVLESNKCPLCTTDLIERFTVSQSIYKYTKSMSDGTKNTDITKVPGFINVQHLMKEIKNIFFCKKEGIQQSTVFIFYLNLLKTISEVTPEAIVESIKDLITEMFNRKNSFEPNEFECMMTFITTYIYVFLDKNPELKESAKIAELSNALMPNGFTSNVPLPIAILCIKSGMNVNITLNDVYDMFKKEDSNNYHSLALLLSFMIPKADSITNELLTVLKSISSVASGSYSLFFKDAPSLHNEKLFSSNTVKASEIILSGCSEMIQMIRYFLSFDNEMKTLITDIFKYILAMTSNDENLKKEVNVKFEMFNDPILIYAVFAVLSNVIEFPHKFSLIKNTATNVIYYISAIDKKSNCYLAWKLPINDKSKIEVVPFSPNISPISKFSFSVNLFSNYRYLIPHFISTLKDSNENRTTEQIGADFYILSSLQEYIKSSSFLNEFVQSFGLFSLPAITYKKSLNAFRKILKHHINNGRNGFNSNLQSSFIFEYASPADIVDPSSYSITFNNISCKAGIHAFITPTLSSEEKTYFTFNILKVINHVMVGFVSFSCDYGNDENFLVDASNTKSRTLGNEEKDITCSSYYLTMEFDPSTGVATLYDKECKAIESVKFTTKQVSCMIQFYGEGSIMYSVSNKLSKAENIFSEQESDLPITSLRKSSSESETNQTLFTVQTDFDLKKDLIMRSIQKMKLNFSTAKSSAERNSLITYSLPNDYDGDIDPNFFNEKPRIQQISFQNKWVSPSSSTFGETVLSNGTYDDMVNTVFSDSNTFIIDETTGEKVLINNKKEHKFSECNKISSISLEYWGTLPTYLLNFYTSGIVEQKKLSCINDIFLSYISIPNVDTRIIICSFSYNLIDLLNHLLSLLILNENINSTNIIDFDTNYLDPETPPKDPSLYFYKNSISKILSIIQVNGLYDDFAKTWVEELLKCFNDGHYHSAVGYPSAFIVKGSEITENITYYNPNAKSWIIMRGDFRFGKNPLTVKTSSGIKTVDNNIVIAEGQEFEILADNEYNESSFVIIPINKDSNEHLSGTFIGLIVSFKYLVKFLNENSSEICPEQLYHYKIDLYTAVTDSIIAGSPYFASNADTIIQFIDNNLSLMQSDLCNAIHQRLLFIEGFVHPKNGSFLHQWIQEKKILWEEHILIPIKSFFPEFQTYSDSVQVSLLNDPQFHLPKPVIPWEIDPQSKDFSKIVSAIKNIFKPYKTIKGYPFYYIIHFWAAARLRSPPCVIENIDTDKIKIDFTDFIPNKFYIAFNGDGYDGKYTCSFDNTDFWTAFDEIETNGNKTIYVTIEKEWSDYIFSIETNDKCDMDEFMFNNREKFVEDMKHLILRWPNDLDQKILSCFPLSFSSKKILDLKFSPSMLNVKELENYSVPLLYTRACCLLIIKWMIIDVNIKEFDPHLFTKIIPMELKLNNLNDAIKRASSYGEPPTVRVSRIKALNLRNGTSNNVYNSLCWQISKQYYPRRFRTSSRPLTVELSNEMGLDLGGPGREIVTEAAIELVSPNSGIVVQTPNGRNNIGGNRDVFVPFPRGFSNPNPLYTFVGGLIAMCIRTGLVQDFSFPHFIWDFFITEKLTIEDIFEIDQNYKTLINSLNEAIRSGMSQEQFQREFDITFVVNGITGSEYSLTPRGRNERVTLENAEQFITLANQFRINEIKQYLVIIKDGFWQNLGIQIPEFVDGSTLEYAACGEREISFISLRKFIKFFDTTDTQEKLFIDVIKAFTSEQRAKLVKFISGRSKLPINCKKNGFYINVRSVNRRDRLPGASTCYNNLYLPHYSSFDIAYRMISTAIEFTNTFENY